MIPYKQVLGYSGKVKLPSNRKKPRTRTRLGGEEPSAVTGLEVRGRSQDK